MFASVQITKQHTVLDFPHMQNFRIVNIFIQYRPRTKLKVYVVLLNENFGNEKRQITVVFLSSGIIREVLVLYVYISVTLTWLFSPFLCCRRRGELEGDVTITQILFCFMRVTR